MSMSIVNSPRKPSIPTTPREIFLHNVKTAVFFVVLATLATIAGMGLLALWASPITGPRVDRWLGLPETKKPD